MKAVDYIEVFSLIAAGMLMGKLFIG